MSYALLAIGAAALLLALNARYPVRHTAAFVPSFFLAWGAIELAPHLLVAEIAAIAGTALAGGLAGWPGWTGLVLGAAGTAGTVANILASRRTVVTLRDSGAPLDLDPEGAPRYPFWHLVVPPACLIPRRGVKVRRDVVFHEEGRLRLKADVFRPAREGDGLRPGLLEIHGGGWVIGSRREQGLPLLNHMALQGWVGFNVDYRLSPKATWPEHLLDLKRFIKWYREHAAEYGADPGCLYVTGGSAGGHLTAMVALTANLPEFQPGFEDVDTSVKGAVPFYGVYDFVGTEACPVPRPMVRLLERVVLKKSAEKDPEAFAKASPMHYLRPDAPPFFVIHGSHDSLIPVEGARAFAERLREASESPVVYAEMKGGQHAFDVFPSYRTARVIEGVERYLTGLHREYGRKAAGAPPAVPDEVTDSLG
ncbi:alpha/beta hydrolase [Spirillospora sp. NPDC029432]|uniref:alpha/beta hydrolase n=1 Tax=Spirillospora sp. NPDC029432 TaxID=3154599 RepID=UPI0034522D2D